MEKNNFQVFWDGLFFKNPIFVLVLGMCPTLATSTSIENAIGMGLATMLVLIASSLIVSIIRKYISEDIRVPAFIVIIASFVTVINLLMEAFAPKLFKSLGIYMPLIVVNCIVLGRALAFAYRNPPIKSLFDGFGTGMGFTLGLILIATIREVIGTGKIIFMGHELIISNGLSINLFITPPGALLTIGLLLGLFNYIKELRRKFKTDD